MAIQSVPVTTATINNTMFLCPGDVTEDPREYAITCMIFCNTSNNDVTLTVQAVPYLVTRDTSTIIIKDLLIPGGETFTFDTEKLVLATGDAIHAYASSNNTVTATISHMRVA
jgi:hypothetical protein